MEELQVRYSTLHQTEELGLKIGQLLVPSLVIGLDGTLGSGKTKLVQAIAVGLGIPSQDVVSPTFTICVPHLGRLKILHLDAYRIKHQEEVDELGLDEEVEDGAVLLVEWAERIKISLPPIDIGILVTPIDEATRQFVLTANTEKAQPILAALICWSENNADDPL